MSEKERLKQREGGVVWQSMYYSYIITMRSRSARAKWGPLVQLLIIYAAGWTDRQTDLQEGGSRWIKSGPFPG